MLAELAKREKEENIKPDADMDVFMKVKQNFPSLLSLMPNLKYIRIDVRRYQVNKPCISSN